MEHTVFVLSQGWSIALSICFSLHLNSGRQMNLLISWYLKAFIKSLFITFILPQKRKDEHLACVHLVYVIERMEKYIMKSKLLLYLY